MPLIVTGEPGRWERTPKSRITTVKYRLERCTDLDEPHRVQREAFDWALGVLEHEPTLPIRAPRADAQSLVGTPRPAHQ